MTLKQIEYFQMVCEKGNISAAAQALYISRSVVSRTISDIEEAFGVPVFIRSGNGDGDLLAVEVCDVFRRDIHLRTLFCYGDSGRDGDGVSRIVFVLKGEFSAECIGRILVCTCSGNGDSAYGRKHGHCQYGGNCFFHFYFSSLKFRILYKHGCVYTI